MVRTPYVSSGWRLLPRHCRRAEVEFAWPLSPSNADKVGDPLDWYERLTPREREVLEAYSQEHSYKAVARRLGKSQSVVDHQLLSARKKMGVVSMAEAMFLLAERNTRKSDRGAEEDRPSAIGREATSSAVPHTNNPLKRRFSVLAVAITVLAVAVIAAFALEAYMKPDYSRHTSEEIVAEIRSLRPSDPDVDEKVSVSRERVALVEVFSDRAWSNLWGAEEDHLKSLAQPVAPDILRAFHWAMLHDHDAAVHIIGNGHRLFSLIPELSDWRNMASQAVALEDVRHGVEYGRALCGVAFAHWADNRPLTRRVASQAAQIFRTVGAGDHRFDEANALHHQSLGYRSGDSERFDLCRQALGLWQQLGDERGIGQGWLSLAQAGWRGPNGDEPTASADAALRAVESFRKVGNENMVDESVNELTRKVSAISGDITHRELIRKIRGELAKIATVKHLGHQLAEQFALLADCIEIDGRMGEQSDLIDDINALLGDVTGPIDGTSSAEIAGFYDLKCRGAGIVPEPSVKRFATHHPEKAKAGESMTVGQIANLVRNLRPN